MERHKCKLCSRSFSNGRALGGHMKAHLATLPLPPNLSYSSHSQQHLLEDRESETESSKNPTRQRSKRNRKSSMPKLSFGVSTPPHPDPEPLSSVSDTSPEEDVAMCLMMLSRDTWKDQTNAAPPKPRATGSSSSPLRRVRGRHHHLCPNCAKTFRSSRALASHTSVCCQLQKNNTSKTFQCPFCYKVFGSGQALGGHKRSHLIPSTLVVDDSVKLKQSFIDLNLPAPPEDDDLSVVSDA